MEAAGGGKGGGGKKRSRGGSGRGVWNIESRRGLCSAGLRPEGGAAQRLRKKGGGGSSAGRGRELPARRRGRGRPPRTVASRCRRPARLLPAAQSASSEASAGGGEGAAAARVLARCLPGGGARAAGARRARAVPARSRALSPRLPSPGGRTRPPARGQDKERGGDPAGWPLTPLAAEPVPEKAGARAPSRGAAVPRGGFRPEPASGARLPIGLPAPAGWGQGHPRGWPHLLSLHTGQRSPRGPHAWARARGAWTRAPRCPGRLETNGCRWRSQARRRRKAASCPPCELKGQDGVLGIEGGKKDFETRWLASASPWPSAFQRGRSFGCFENLKIQNNYWDVPFKIFLREEGPCKEGSYLMLCWMPFWRAC